MCKLPATVSVASRSWYKRNEFHLTGVYLQRERMWQKLHAILMYLFHTFRKHFKFPIMHNTAIPTINLISWDWGINIQNFKTIYIPSSTCLTVQNNSIIFTNNFNYGGHSTCTATMATSSHP